MAIYDDIKPAAAKLRNEPATSADVRRLADVAIALCDRVAELEARHREDVERLEGGIRHLRR